MNQSLIHYISVYLVTGKFPFLVPVIRYPTWCNFIMHCLQNILDIIHTEWALEVSLFWQRSNFPSWNIRYYAHLGNHPVTAVLPPSYGRGVDSTKVILPVYTTLITSWSKDMSYNNHLRYCTKDKKTLWNLLSISTIWVYPAILFPPTICHSLMLT